MYLCRHAVGTVDDYVRKAIALGFDSIGMSDHAPFEELKDRSVRMKPEELEIYLDSCDTAVRTYGERIRVLKGIEIEYFPSHAAYYPMLLKRLDYLALGQHYVDDPGNRNDLCSVYALVNERLIRTYGATIVAGIKSGLFAFVCHPDIMLYGWGKFDDVAREVSISIIEAARTYNVPLEINANGIRKGIRQLADGERYLYPRKEFWEIVRTIGAKVIISSDAHSPDLLWDRDVERCYEFASALGLRVEEALAI
jgi:histidinol-phosphatase (PHP family)